MTENPYNPADYPSFAVTVDIVILTVVEGILKVLLIQRGQGPFRDAWALPGGFVLENEDLYDAALRELKEETNISGTRMHLEQLGTYGTPDRDPRMRVVTVAYWAVVPNLDEPTGGGVLVSIHLLSLFIVNMTITHKICYCQIDIYY